MVTVAGQTSFSEPAPPEAPPAAVVAAAAAAVVGAPAEAVVAAAAAVVAAAVVADDDPLLSLPQAAATISKPATGTARVTFGNLAMALLVLGVWVMSGALTWRSRPSCRRPSCR